MPEPRKRRETAEAPRPVPPEPTVEAAGALVTAKAGQIGERYHESRVQMVPAVLKDQWACLLDVAKGLREGGAFPDTVKSDNQGALILLIGYELDIPYTVACRMIDVISNRPALRGQLVGGLLRSKGCKIEWVESTERKATVKITRPDQSSVQNTVTIEEVAKIRTSEWEDGKKKTIALADKANWLQQPKVMLQRFCLKQTANMFCEDIILGLPSSDEMEIIEAGRTIDVTPVNATPAPAPPAAAAPSGQPSLKDAFNQRLAGAPPAAAPEKAPAPPTSKALSPDSLI